MGVLIAKIAATIFILIVIPAICVFPGWQNGTKTGGDFAIELAAYYGMMTIIVISLVLIKNIIGFFKKEK